MVFKYDELDWREKEILTAIIENPNLTHNALKRYLVERRELMAGDAFEKAIKRLKEANWLHITKDKNTLLYDVPHQTALTDPELDERARTELGKVAELWNTEWKARFHKLELKEKIKAANSTLKGLQDMRNYTETLWLVSYGRTNRTEVQKEVRLKMDELFTLFFKIISDDSDGDRIKLAFTIGVIRTASDSRISSVNLTEDYFSQVIGSAIKKSGDPKLQKWKEGYDAFMKTASAGDKEIIFKVFSREIEPNMQSVEEYKKKDSETIIAKAEEALKNTQEAMARLVKEIEELKNKKIKL
ncbi:MAG: hypothetical protein EX285_05020 [Thaumarchaeota archaeon]|nr:hypothetical protein [Nitrososphaerota archaeon]